MPVTLTTLLAKKDIFKYRITTPVGIEVVNVKLRCYVQYDGPQVQVTFQIPANGNRSRLGRDTYITIGNPLSLQRLSAPKTWPAGLDKYPVVRIPVSIFVDQLWPNANLKVSFMLVVSGLMGFGAKPKAPYIVDYKKVWD